HQTPPLAAPNTVSRRTNKPPAYPAYLAYPAYSPVTQGSYLMPDRRTTKSRLSPHQAHWQGCTTLLYRLSLAKKHKIFLFYY
ncbi:MAG: hypothetical protein IJW17_10520, partial [Lentisphaeria bacterium]|nr:hypothetical protein [Lentisphaeria bacterium]